MEVFCYLAPKFMICIKFLKSGRKVIPKFGPLIGYTFFEFFTVGFARIEKFFLLDLVLTPVG